MSAAVANFWLVVAFLVFVAAMAAVFAVCVRERRRQAPLSGANATNLSAQNTAEDGWRCPEIGHLQAHSTSDLKQIQSDMQSDNRVALVIFGGIVLGALLALCVGYVVFFSGLVD